VTEALLAQAPLRRSHRRLAIVVAVIGTLVSACGPAGSGAGTAVSTAGSNTWPPAGQLTIGTIPTATFNKMGEAFVSPPSDAAPKISQTQAEQIVLAGPIPYSASIQAPRVVKSYLAYEIDESAPDKPGLAWIVDISPTQPFPPLTGGGAGPVASHTPGPPGTPGPVESFPGAIPGSAAPIASAEGLPASQMEHWAWGVVNATTGAATTSFA
jgi:hypothetical protein